MNSISVSNTCLSLVFSSLIFIVPSLGFCLGYFYVNDGVRSDSDLEIVVKTWHEQLVKQGQGINQAKLKYQQKMDAMTQRIGILQAEVTRINALGQRIVDSEKIDAADFDFSKEPAIGGPYHKIDAPEYDIISIGDELSRLDSQVQTRQEQLAVIESLLLDKEITEEVYISGRPVSKGWMSSFYGKRTDPIHGGKAWHNGVDFAGKEDSPVIATASGVVNYIGARGGYGNLIEISHGNGYVTRYGHNKEILVKKGDIVSKGQMIAKMGKSGRSTGPHVHYEIYKNGRSVNPIKFVKRKALDNKKHL